MINNQIVSKRRGIVLAGGNGTRLYPVTSSINKHLLPVYDKPMIYYSLSVLLLAGIREILIISTPESLPLFKKLLGDGSKFGVCFYYECQAKPEGIAQAFIIAEKFIAGYCSTLILGDNIFYSQNFSSLLRSVSITSGATIFTYPVNNPSSYGIVEYDKNNQPLVILEKPSYSRSNQAITGLYFYDEKVVEIAKQVTRSMRGEYEISSINQFYLENSELYIIPMNRGSMWFDSGTSDALLEASQLVKTIEQRQGLKIACLEEIAWRNGWITLGELQHNIKYYPKNNYNQYIETLLSEDEVVF